MRALTSCASNNSTLYAKNAMGFQYIVEHEGNLFTFGFKKKKEKKRK